MTVASSITTAEQLAQEASRLGRCELVRGELIMMSPASPLHGRIANRVASIITNFVDAHRLGAVFAAETGFIIERDPDTVRAPDVSFLRTERATNLPKRGFYPGPPDLAVEVLSPDDTASEVLDKVAQWLEAGTVSVWVIDPQRRTLTVSRADQPSRTLRDHEELADEPLLPGLRVQVAELFK